MALIGNLISNGAGSNELRDAAVAGGLGGMIGKIPGTGLIAGIGSAMKQEITGKAAQKVLPSWAQRSYGNGGKNSGGGEKDEKGSDSKNSNTPVASGGKNKVNEAINGLTATGNDNKNGKNNNKNDNTNNKKTEDNGTGNSLVNQAINNTGTGAGGYDDLYEN